MTRKALENLSNIVINTLKNDFVKTSKYNISVKEKSINNKMPKANTDDKAQTLFLNYDEMYEQGVFDLSRDSIISFSNKIDSKLLKESIIQSVHHSRNVERMNEKGKYLIRKLFEAYYSHPQQLPDGPIIHFMVESKLISSIDKAREEGIGSVRLRFEKTCVNMKLPYKIILMRRICDHIASMTDRYAIEEYNNLYG
jgi:dGTP triphosphohydrolase